MTTFDVAVSSGAIDQKNMQEGNKMQFAKNVFNFPRSIVSRGHKKRSPNTMTDVEVKQIHTWSFGHPAAATSMVWLFKALNCDITVLHDWLLSRNIPLGGTEHVTLEDIDIWWSENWQKIQGQLSLLTTNK